MILWTLTVIIKAYCEQFFAHKFGNLDYIEHFFIQLAKIYIEEKDNLNRPIPIKEF